MNLGNQIWASGRLAHLWFPSTNLLIKNDEYFITFCIVLCCAGYILKLV
jgi:hypothetical protein